MTGNRVSVISVEHKNGTDTNFNEMAREKSSIHEKILQRIWRKQQDKKQVEIVSLRSLFRYAAPMDLFYMLVATLAAMANGASLPLVLIIFGNLLNAFTDRTADLCSFNFTALSLQYCPSGVQLTATNFFSVSPLCNLTESNFSLPFDFKAEIRQQSLYIGAIGCCTILLAYLQVAFWSVPAERQTRTIRETLFRSILNKEISYFDRYKTGELNTQLTDNLNKIHDGIGDKIGSITQFIASFVTGIIIGFVNGWKLTLVILSISPLLFISAMLLSKLSASLSSMELKAYGKAGVVAEEVLSAIRVVVSYNGQEREKQRYKQYLSDAKKMGIKKGIANGLATGFVWFILYCAYALGFWYGAKLIRDGEYNIGRVIIVFFSIVLSIFNFGQASPHLQAFSQARSAAYQVWKVIDTPSEIDSVSETGVKKDEFIGDIHFSSVKFTYPARPDIQVLRNLSFAIKSGQTVALVGSSGSGKSTCIQLLQRFYDPDAGEVCIDGISVNQYNLRWLRQHIGVVSQEPILFQATIRENILLGLDSATDEQVYEAAKMANAHDFISQLPDKYDTQVGERGATLSGGQKQRIAIARALIRNPRILLLDEATSALDNESEKIVHDALNQASQDRTTVVVAHRLSTIRNADKIIVMQNGEIVEEGDHNSLIQARGTYFSLVERQNLSTISKEERQKNSEELATDLEGENKSGVTDLPQSNSMVIDSTMNQAVSDDVPESATKKTEKRKHVAWTMFIMNKPEWVLIGFGCIACICNGGLQPVFGLILSKLMAVFHECDNETQERRVLLFVLLFIGLGLVSLCTMFIQGFFFAWSGESLTARLRFKAFAAFLKQEIAYFDDSNNNTGALCTRLATEASAVQGATGIRVGILLQNFASLATGVIISFAYSWQLTLLVIAFIPLMIAGGFLETRLITGFAKNDKKSLENAGKISVAAIQNIRTVAQLTKEDYFYHEYSKLLKPPLQSALKRAHVFGFFYSLTSSVVFFVLVALFMVGADLVHQNKLTFEDILQVMNCLMFSAQSVGQTASLTPDYSKAINSASDILDLLDRKPLIDNGSSDGKEMSNFSGDLQFKNVHFNYPTRPESKVLKKFQLRIKAGQRVALVGSSGCGKSTSIQLIERFYDVENGHLLIDSEDVRNLNLQWYRSQLGIVFQEPILFDMSIRENIAYGDNIREEIPMEEIIRAAKDANIHDFVQCLPNGYETNCGAKGTQLSGGQKQRIAIARALIRNPKILLLDEATSALDSESEKVVQDALDRAQQGRTSITIAHRLSTIQNADVICVVHDGVVVESGRHQELIAQHGRYYQLVLQKLQ